jgi:MinD-like ATPase involved in chromosome partitioning or flagellar assembly
VAELDLGMRGRPFASLVSWSRELEEADAAVRTPLGLSRRVGVVAVEPRSGASTVTAALVGLLASRRRGAVLGVDAGGGGLAALLGTGAAPADPEDQLGSDPGSDLGNPPRGGGLQRLDLARDDESWPAPVERWRAEVAPVSRFYDLVVTDWGTRPWSADLTEAASTSHVVVLVARADRRAALEAAAGLSLIRDAGPSHGLLVLVDVDRTSDRPAARLARQLGVPVTTVGHEPQLASHLAEGRRLPARTRLSVIRIAQAVVEQAVLSALPRSQPEGL